MSLNISYSGIRGKDLTRDDFYRMARAYGDRTGGKNILLGRDTRKNSAEFAEAAKEGLLDAGRNVVDLGVCPTPTLQNTLQHDHKLTDQGGALMVTASHNPQDDNGLKIFSADGLILGAQEHRIIEIRGRRGLFGAAGTRGKYSEKKDAIRSHIVSVLLYFGKSYRRLRVVVDLGNGAGAAVVGLSPSGQTVIAVEELLGRMNCEVHCINTETDGVFRRPPEPRPENLTALAEKVLELKADIGFALDADADRLVIVSEQGKPLLEEYTLALAMTSVISQDGFRGGWYNREVVISMSTSRMIEVIAQREGGKVHRVPTGERNVIRKMREVKAIIGGEGNGGVIDPRTVWGRDSFSAMALVIRLLNYKYENSVSELCQYLPGYYMAKKRIEGLKREEGRDLLDKFEKAYREKGEIDKTDGVRIAFSDESWLLVRQSNTEPIIRVVVETPKEERLCEIIAEFEREMGVRIV